MNTLEPNTRKFWCIFNTKTTPGVAIPVVSSFEEGSRDLALIERALNERITSGKHFDGGVVLPVLDAGSGSPVIAGTCCAKSVPEGSGQVGVFGYICPKPPVDLLEAFQANVSSYADASAPYVVAFLQEQESGDGSGECLDKLKKYMDEWETSLTFLSRVLKALAAASTGTTGEEQARHLAFCIQAILAGAPELVRCPEGVTRDDFEGFVAVFSLLRTGEGESKEEEDVKKKDRKYFSEADVDPECLLWAQRLVCSTGCESPLAIKSCAEKAKLSVSKTIKRFHSYLSKTSSDYHAIYKALQFVETSELANTLKFIIRNNLLSDTKSSGHENLGLIVELLDRDKTEIVFAPQ